LMDVRGWWSVAPLFLCVVACNDSNDCACFDGSPIDDALVSDSGAADIASPAVDPLCLVQVTDAAPSGACIAVDDGGVQCNPITNEPCNADAGETCDIAPGGFRCWAPPPANTAGLCLSCDDINGPACAPGSTCAPTPEGNVCARFCCIDGDCQPDGVCSHDLEMGAVGVCVAAKDGG
jgi:hypothetical protein